MKNDLIERYIYAVTKRLPRKNREDVAQELQGLIDDMLLERCGNLTPTEKDIRVVLTELGSPQELYEKYDENSKKCLIGQPHYNTYLFVLKIVLVCAAGGLTLSNVILQLLEPQIWYAALGQWIAMLWQGLMGAFAFVTLLFAFFYHKDVKIGEPFNFDELPPVPKRNEEISKWEPIAGIVFSVVFLVLFLVVPEAICIIYRGGELVPIFDAGAMRGSWYIILLFTLLGVSRETVKLLERRYNKSVMVVTLGSNLVSAVLAIWWLTRRELFNPVFKEKMMVLFEDPDFFMVGFFENFQYFFLAVILFALGLDTVETVVKSLRK